MSNMKVVRKKLNENLTEFVSKGHGVIYGAPGAGKSYAIQVLADSLVDSGVPSTIVPVEQLNEGTSKEIIEYLQAGFGEEELLNDIPLKMGRRGVLFLDGYDAARDPSVETNLQKAVLEIQDEMSNWNLIMTIREYDLDKNLKLQKNLNLVKLGKHKNTFKIEEFDDAELAAGLTSAGFKTEDIFKNASIDFKKLLKNPFSLWIFTRIFDPEDSIDYLLLKNEAQLLKVYVDRTIGSDAKVNTLVSDITHIMVEKGVLNINTNDLFSIGEKENIERLFSQEIIIQSLSGKNRIHFKHNIFFDYLVSRYCFERSAKDFIAYLIEDKRRSLFLQQSLKLFFFDIWDNDRTLYWSLTRLMFENTQTAISLISKTIPFLPVITSLTDAAELDGVLLKDDLFRRLFVKYLLFGYQVYPETNLAIRVSIYESLSFVIDESFVWNLSVQVINEVDRYGQEYDRIKLSKTLINVHKFILNNTFSFSASLMAFWILPGFIKTLDLDREYKVDVIHNILKSIGTENYSIQQLYKMCSMVKNIIDFEPALAEEVYKRVFEYKENSEEPVHMGSPILPLRSNRRQDYEMCCYHLNESIGYFLERSVKHGVAAGIKAGEGEIFRSHIKNKSQDKIIKLQYEGAQYSIILDYSYIWSDNSRLGDYGIQILEKSLDHISVLFEAGQSLLAVGLFEYAMANAQTAFAWKTLIEVANKDPQELASKIVFLLRSPEVLRNPEFDYVIGNCISNLYSHLSSVERSLVEVAINSIDGESGDEYVREFNMEKKDKYILALPEDMIAAPELVTRRQFLLSKNVNGKFEKHFSIEAEWTKYSHDDYLKESGVDMNAKETKEGLHLVENFENTDFSDEKDLSDEDTKKLKFFIEQIGSILDKTSDKKLYSDLLRRTLGKINRLFFKISKHRVDLFKDIFSLVQSAAQHPDPIYDEKYHSSFDNPSWSPEPRTEAAELICKMSVVFHNSDVEITIANLLSDDVPAVRFLTGAELWRVFFSDTSFFWISMSDRSVYENNRTVKTALLGSLIKIYLKDIPNSERIMSSIFDISKDDHLTEMLGGMVVDLAVQSAGTFGSSTLEKVISDPLSHRNVLRDVVNRLSNGISFGLFQDKREHFLRSLEYSKSIVRSCSALLPTMDKKSSEIREVYDVLSNFIMRLYFNSQLEGIENTKVREVSEYFSVLSEMIDDLVKAAVANKFLDASTVHYFVQMMENIVVYMPRSVVFWTRDMVSVGRSGDYQIDMTAVKEVVQLVEVLLATNKEGLAKNSDELDAMIDLLDIFAEVGQPEALKATWKLDSVFR